MSELSIFCDCKLNPYPAKHNYTALQSQKAAKQMLPFGFAEQYGRFNQFYDVIKSLLLRAYCVFGHRDLQIFGLKLNKNK